MNRFKKILVILLLAVVTVSVALCFIGKDNVDADGEIVEPYYDMISAFYFDDCSIDGEGEKSIDLRTGPGKEYGLITKISPDSEIEVLGFSEKNSEWLYVNCNDVKGWLPNRFITFSNDYCIEAENFKVNYVCRVKFENNDAADLNVYSESDTDSDVIYTLKKCDIVLINDDYNAKNNGLIKMVMYVDGGGYTDTIIGWVDAHNLERIGRLGEPISNNEYADILIYKVPDDISSYDEQCQYEAVVVDTDKPIALRRDIDDASDIIVNIEPMSLIYIMGKSHSTDEKVLVYCPITNKHGWTEKEYLAPVEDVTIVDGDESISIDGTIYKYVGAEPFKICNEGDAIALMSAPDKNSRCILKIQKGVEFTVTVPFEGVPDWNFVSYDDGLTKHYGFVYGAE